ncbi:N-acetylmuramoyl-L-alanine amidase [Saonia flava]|uniref:N-acetylmuramoyl-L-alanine amidase n=2 Tax=Saonia flava TaxID=523696 RepID=A0A846QQC3_9FLAO|nr:N-acetylmuramoyl-L-alanine amidase [Saonia flava]NJB70308.1 N-acetylmuramoyl-L-alanine amidase [Saonia flava]
MNKLYRICFIALVLLSMSFSKNSVDEQLSSEKFVVVLDAGHGGHDPGNLGNGYLEKNIALNIVLQVGAILEKNPNIEVIYTRKDDTFVDLYVRGEIANKANADLFVSVHCDSHSSDAHGAGTFVLGLHVNKQNFDIAKKENSVIYLEDNYESRYAAYDINSPESVIGLTIMQEEFLDQSIALAKMMQDNFTEKLKRKDRKVKQAGFIVLHQTVMPSVLVETGFLTNKSEGSYLDSKNGQKEMGNAIANAIIKYKGDFKTDLGAVSTPVVDEEKPTIGESKVDEIIVERTPDKEVVKEMPKVIEDTPKVIEKTVENTPIIEEKTVKSVENIVYKVQLLASSKDLPLNPENFGGLNKLTKEPFNSLYRYMYGETNSYLQAKLLKSNADAKGYTTSYIVAYKDGNRIPLDDALKYVSQ